jgi:hypothetical protein
MSIVKRPSQDIEFLPDNKQYTNRFEINSETSDRVYTVAQRKSNGEWCCSCPGWIRHRHCKHLSAIEEVLPLVDKKRRRLK